MPDDGTGVKEERMTIASQLSKMLTIIGKPDGVRNPDGKLKIGQLLFDIYVWQELQKHATSQCKRAWAEAVSKGSIDNDDALREQGGEHTVQLTPHFALQVKVQPGRELFDKDEFIRRVAKKYDLRVSALELLANDCKCESKPSLSKKVIELQPENV
jgi:hypothetical protein